MLRSLIQGLLCPRFRRANTSSVWLILFAFLTIGWRQANAGTFDGPAELPRVYLQTLMAQTPAPGKTWSVAAGGSFQAALNSVHCGDTIALQAGATFTGHFTFPALGCDDQHWIIIRTSAPNTALPPEGTRLTPCYSGVSSLPGRPPLNCKNTNVVTAKIVADWTGGAIVLSPGATHYRFVGLEITRLPASSQIPIVYQLATALPGPADHIIFDRVWMHGNAQDDTAHGFRASGITSAAVVDSYLNDFHCVAITGSCTDSQAISGGNGSVAGGPYKIVNNFLEAAGQSILFGGGPGPGVPADIEIRRNHLFKPLTWMQGQPGYVGGKSGHPFAVKNLLELKNAQRLLFEGNILEHAWGGFSQVGFAVVFTPRGSWAPVQDITVRYNQISHVAAGMQLSATRNLENGVWVDSLAAQRWSIHDDVVDDLNGAFYQGPGVVFQIGTGMVTRSLNNLTINHVTAFADPAHGMLSVGGFTNVPKAASIDMTNSIFLAGKYPVWSTGMPMSCAISGQPQNSFNACWNGYTVTANALIGTTSTPPNQLWPTGNYFPANPTAVQFVNFNNGNGGDYHLQSGSPYKNMGTDGKDLGADITALQAATSGVY